MFEKYSDLDREADEHFYSSLDPFFFLRIVVQFDQEAPHGIVAKPKSEGDDISKQISQMDALLSNFDETRLAITRFTRYLASETLLLVFLSGYPFGPFAKLSSSLKNDELNATFQNIANKEIPDKFQLLIDEKNLDFESWVDHLLTGSAENPFDGSVYSFFADEARFAADRSAVNAFKHGRILKASKHYPFSLTIRDEDGKLHSLFDDNESGLSWVEWKEDKKRSEGIFTLNSETTDFLEDKSRILISAMLVNVIKTIRLAQLRGKQSANIEFIPKAIKSAKQIRKLQVHRDFKIKVEAPQ